MNIKEYFSTLDHCPFCKKKFFIEDWHTKDDFSKTLTCSGKHKDSSDTVDYKILKRNLKRTLLIWCWANPDLKIAAVNLKLKNVSNKFYCQLCFDLKRVRTEIFSYDLSEDIGKREPIMSFDHLIDIPFEEEALRNKIKNYFLFK